MTTARDKPPFVVSQGVRLLLDTDRPQRFLRAEFFRAGRRAGPSVSEADLGTWAGLARADVVAGQTTLADGSACSLRRLAITTDAGVGKTIALRWLGRELNRPGGQTAAFFLQFHQLPLRAEDLLPHTLVPALQHAAGNEASHLSAEDALRVLESLRRQGRIVLLLDALDQAPPDGAAVQVLRDLLDDHDWDGCRIVVSGRPYALQRHWERLFAAGLGFGWRFVQLDEFDADQQRQFLGRTRDGRERYDLIPEPAREILGTPRVLEYLRDLPDRDLQQVRTAGDVYWHSINHLLREGLKNSERGPAPGAVAGRADTGDRASPVAGSRPRIAGRDRVPHDIDADAPRAARGASWRPTSTASRPANSSGSRMRCTSCWRGVRGHPSASTWTAISTAWPR